MTSFFEHGPYPEHWTDAQVKFWEDEPNTMRIFYTGEEWEQLQEVFERAFLDREIPREERDAAREEFWELSGVAPENFDWRAFREYLGY